MNSSKLHFAAMVLTLTGCTVLSPPSTSTSYNTYNVKLPPEINQEDWSGPQKPVVPSNQTQGSRAASGSTSGCRPIVEPKLGELPKFNPAQLREIETLVLSGDNPAQAQEAMDVLYQELIRDLRRHAQNAQDAWKKAALAQIRSCK